MLSARKKKGLGMLISGVVFLAVGGVFMAVDTTPDWLAVVMQAVGVIGNLLGFKIVFPDTDEKKA